MSKQIDLPKDCKDLIQQILDYIETETGEMHEIKISRFGHYEQHSLVIGDFEKRTNKIEVYEMEEEYKELIGIYDSKNDVRAKITQLMINDVCEARKQAKIDCETKNCHSYYNSKWNNMMLDHYTGWIFISSGGSDNECYDKGKFRLIK